MQSRQCPNGVILLAGFTAEQLNGPHVNIVCLCIISTETLFLGDQCGEENITTKKNKEKKPNLTDRKDSWIERKWGTHYANNEVIETKQRQQNETILHSFSVQRKEAMNNNVTEDYNFNILSAMFWDIFHKKWHH